MEDLQIYFNSDEAPHPYIHEIYDYQNDGVKGFIEFDGYYYVNDSDTELDPLIPHQRYQYSLPQEIQMLICRDCILINAYEIEIYKREKIYNTDTYSSVDDLDGSEMNICFFPTDYQRIYFRVLDIMVEPERSENEAR